MFRVSGLLRFVVAALFLCVATGAHAQSVSIEGGEAEEVARILNESTNLPQLIAQDPDLVTTQADPRQAIENERQRLVGILKNKGYLDAEVAVEPSHENDGAKLQVRVFPGPRYVVGAADVAVLPDVGEELADELISASETAIGRRADDGTRSDLFDRLLWILGRGGYPFASIESYALEPSGSGRTATLSVKIAPGALARFTAADYSSVDPALLDSVAQRIPFSPGDVYSVERLDVFRRALGEEVGAVDARVDVIADGADGFSLAVRARHAPAMFPDTWMSALGFALLTACLCLLALRQALVAGHLSSLPVRVVSIAAGALFVSSGCLLLIRATSLI